MVPEAGVNRNPLRRILPLTGIATLVEIALQFSEPARRYHQGNL